MVKHKMSHRITTKTEIKDLALAKKALDQAGMGYRESGTTLAITSGSLRGATMDLATGEISGDSDFHSRDSLGALRQIYAEQLVRSRIQMAGHYVESREMQDGKIILHCVAATG